MASHLASLWSRGLGQLGNGLLKSIAGVNIKRRHAYDNECIFFGVALLSLVLPLRLRIESLSNDDGKGNENGWKAKGLDWQNNNFSHVSSFLLHFFAVAARLQRESA